ncbi:hypothetical protein PIB30_058233 [Stylosanthes scabra]|uniref:Uncharacterized protein n=1 Tax=Stylosanthes scabra TaxID=79078 RepID=A0ABU6UKE6_9FABA|nr:hypothetical protein [Stylosanthes scabra]
MGLGMRVKNKRLGAFWINQSIQAKIRKEVAKNSARNEKITKKSLEVKSSAYAYIPKTDVRMHCHDLGGTFRLEPDPMRMHLKRVVTLCPGCGVKCANDLSRWSLRATDGRNGVNLEAVNATPLPITGGP